MSDKPKDDCENLIEAYEGTRKSFELLCSDANEQEAAHCQSLRQALGTLAAKINRDCPDYFKLGNNRIDAEALGIDVEG